eukprot:scaffold196787_cov28-Attheya_sp.AAC.1
MMRNVVLVALLSGVASAAFVGSNTFRHSTAAAASSESRTSLSMSAALIVQNKGGGHGELGTCPSCTNLQWSFTQHSTQLVAVDFL